MSGTKGEDIPKSSDDANKDQSGSGQVQAERAPTVKEQKQIDAEEHASIRDKLSDKLDN